jgi:galactokinase
MTTTPESLPQRMRRVGSEIFARGWAPGEIVRAPGRIEIIGNHVDYNGGPVLAAAIDREIHVGARTTGTTDLRVAFADQPDPGPFDAIPADLVDWRLEGRHPRPIDYLRGVIASLHARDRAVRSGLEMVVAGNLPAGLGISSSAALCVSLTFMLAGERPPDGEIVLIAQEAEHRVGSPCGTMDQSASVSGGLISYSGADNSVRAVAADLGDLVFVVINSGVERNLATSSYPERVKESQAALSIVRRELDPDLAHLAEIQPDSLAEIESLLSDSGKRVLADRVRHVVTESARVRSAIDAVGRRDWSRVGRLMTASGESSSRDYEISHPAVDKIVQISLRVDGVLGARMMGGGEGGAALALIRRHAVDNLESVLEQGYFAPRGLEELHPKVVPCTFAWCAGRVVE